LRWSRMMMFLLESMFQLVAARITEDSHRANVFVLNSQEEVTTNLVLLIIP